MKNRALIIVAIITAGTVNAQLKGMEEYTTKAKSFDTSELGKKTKLPNGYTLNYDLNNWNDEDLGDLLTETERILSLNGVNFNEAFLDESDIDVSDGNFYDPHIIELIISYQRAIKKAWAVENKDGSFELVTLIATSNGIELVVRRVTK